MMNKEMSKSAARPLAENSPATAEGPRVQTIVPPFDIYENADEYLIRADVPGVRAEQLEIELRDGELGVKATATAMGVGLDLLLGGRSGFAYALRFRVPAGIDGDKVHAELAHGVLSLHLPKAESRKPRQIPVRAPS